jgi:isoquinoline 1-oxidoreductase beta subunit
MWHDRFAAGLDAQGNPSHGRTIVGQSIAGTSFETVHDQGGSRQHTPSKAPPICSTAFQSAGGFALAEDRRARPVVALRRPFTHRISVESFFRRSGAPGGKDPYELRRKLLANQPRMLALLQLVAEKAGWGKPLPAGRGRGIATHFSFDSYVAQVIEASVDKDGTVRVHRVVCAVDCGRTVNPDIVNAQMEGGIIFGLTAALKTEITLENGRVQQTNFHDYQMLRMFESPQIEVHIVPSEQNPTGVGEPSVPPVAPALTNAIFAATGKRIRRLPIRASDLAGGSEVKS